MDYANDYVFNDTFIFYNYRSFISSNNIFNNFRIYANSIWISSRTHLYY